MFPLKSKDSLQKRIFIESNFLSLHFQKVSLLGEAKGRRGRGDEKREGQEKKMIFFLGLRKVCMWVILYETTSWGDSFSENDAKIVDGIKNKNEIFEYTAWWERRNFVQEKIVNWQL